ncbi:hypothetical protein, partial [Saccharothrix lopnurensis]
MRLCVALGATARQRAHVGPTWDPPGARRPGSPRERCDVFERFTDRARRVVVLAQEEARMLNHNYIG